MLVKLQIDAAHSHKLARGEPVTIKVPKGATKIELRLKRSARDDSFAKICDVVFNGRPA